MLWIGIRIFPRHGWGFPLVLPVLEETLEEILEFLNLWRPLLAKRKLGMGGVYGLVRGALDFLREVRVMEPCTLVQVDTEKASVDVRLI